VRKIVILATSLSLAATSVLGSQPADTIRRNVEPLFDKRDALLGAGFAVGTVLMFPLDRRLADRLQDPSVKENRFLKTQTKWLQDFGYPGSLIIGGSMYAIGRVSGQKEMADLGLHGTEAIIIGEGIAGLIKGVVGRQRPTSTSMMPTASGSGVASRWTSTDPSPPATASPDSGPQPRS
jgi:hypothetical protein